MRQCMMIFPDEFTAYIHGQDITIVVLGIVQLTLDHVMMEQETMMDTEPTLLAQYWVMGQ